MWPGMIGIIAKQVIKNQFLACFIFVFDALWRRPRVFVRLYVLCVVISLLSFPFINACSPEIFCLVSLSLATSSALQALSRSGCIWKVRKSIWLTYVGLMFSDFKYVEASDRRTKWIDAPKTHGFDLLKQEKCSSVGEEAEKNKSQVFIFSSLAQ